MNDAQADQLLHRLLCGYLSFYFKQEKYELRSASNNIKYEADLLYHNIINEEKYNEWITEESMIPTMISLGIWSTATDSLIKGLQTKIDNIKVELFQNFTMTSKQTKIRQNLKSTKKQLDKILSTKQDFFNNTLEGYATSIKNEYIICNTLYKDNKKVFNYAYNSSNMYVYFNDLVAEISKHSISIESLKALARHSSWRSYWNANKENLFAGPVSDWTDDQRGIVNISKMYDSVYEHPDCPNEKVIEDDDMLDGWMITQKRKIEKEKNKKVIDDISPKLKNAQEIFLMANNQEDAENILSLNSVESMHRMKQKINTINQLGEVEESQLPDVKIDLMQQASELRKSRK